MARKALPNDRKPESQVVFKGLMRDLLIILYTAPFHIGRNSLLMQCNRLV